MVARSSRWGFQSVGSVGTQCAFGIALALGLGLLAGEGRAQTPTTNDVKALVQQFDTLANGRDAAGLGELYSPNFSNSDGLTLDQVKAGLGRLWELYPDLTYRTELKGWRQEGESLVVETATTLQGQRPWLGKQATLTGEVTSRQTFTHRKLVRQEILEEKMTLTAGEKPLTVEVRVPSQVRAGQSFDFDVIVQTPLGDDLLAGNAFAEAIAPDLYQFDPTQLKLELLKAGGLFKRVTAPSQSQWLSAFLVSPDGMVLVTQRLAIAR